MGDIVESGLPGSFRDRRTRAQLLEVRSSFEQGMTREQTLQLSERALWQSLEMRPAHRDTWLSLATFKIRRQQLDERWKLASARLDQLKVNRP